MALYLAERTRGGASTATLRKALATVNAAHEAQGEPSPTKHPGVKAAMPGFARQGAGTGNIKRQARALDAEAVATIRGHLKGKDRTTKSGALSMALCSVMAEAGLRRSEASALTWSDVERQDDGMARTLVRHPKTDQEGIGSQAAIAASAIRDLEALSGFVDASPGAPVFSGLVPYSISRRVAGVAKQAGLGDGFSGHSGRVSMALGMTRKGAPVQAVMQQGSWPTTRMVAMYTRGESADETLKYL